MGMLTGDIRHGIRVLAKSPAFAAGALLTPALGIGAITAIFSVINGVLLSPLPYGNTDRVVTLWQNNVKEAVVKDDVSPANFLDFRDRNRVFDRLAAVEPWSFDLSDGPEPRTIRGWLVTEGFFEILGTPALHGRTLAAEDHQPGNQNVVILGHDLWLRDFGGTSEIVGQKLTLRGQAHTVVGVMPEGFEFPGGREIWAPRIFAESDLQRRGSNYLKVVGLLQPGVEIEAAREDLNRVAAGLAVEHPRTNSDTGVSLVAMREHIVGGARPTLLLLFAAAGLVLLIACANLAGLMVVRGAARAREFAIRAALGATRSRIMRQLITETMLICLAGGAAGLLLTVWGIDSILALRPGSIPRADAVTVDASVLAFALIISGATALLAGLAPAINAFRLDLSATIREGPRAGSGVPRRLLRGSLVVIEVAIAVMLLVGAGLLGHSFLRVSEVNPGFEAKRVVALETHVWARNRTPGERRTFFRETLDGLSNLESVTSAGAVSALPFLGDSAIDINTTLTIDGQPPPAEGEEPGAYQTVVAGDYFTAMGIPVTAGRGFTRFDNEDSAPVVIINETMSRRYWPDTDPIGARINARLGGQQGKFEIVGVVGDVRHTGLDSNPRPEYFVPHAQYPYGSMTYVARTTREPSEALPAIKREIWSVNSSQPFSSINTLDALISRSLAERRFNLTLVGIFAGIALSLAAIGIYGLISVATAQRGHEVAIRLALGARRAQILRMLIGEGVLWTGMGLAVGLAGSLMISGLLERFLYGIRPNDPATIGAIGLLIIFVSLVAAYIPARRATRVEPLQALKSD